MKPNNSTLLKSNGWRTLADAVKGADVFLGCSKAGALKPEMVKTMAENPLILALANPVPEITPDEAKQFVQMRLFVLVVQIFQTK